MIEESIRTKVESNLAPVYLELENESHGHNVPKGSETHFRMVVVSDLFQGLSRVDRQRKITALLDEERAKGLHALSLRAYTPEEWSKVQPTFEMQSPLCHSKATPKK